MYNIDEIKEFIKVLEESSLSILEIQKDDGSKIHLEKAQPTQIVSQVVGANPISEQIPAQNVKTVDSPAKEEENVPAVTDNAKTINAPIVGVFYVAPAPGKEPYVSVGKKVNKGDTVGIIEAMKCMNEIQAEDDGEIVEILAKDGELVEYGQPLFKIV